MTKNTAKPASADAPAEKATVARKRPARRRKPSSGDIAVRAYFIHLDEGEHDELANWLRAEQELKAA